MSLWLDMSTLLLSLLRQQIHEAGQRFFDGMMGHERQELVHRFMDLDENGDGRISVQELLNRYGGSMNGGAAVQDRVRVLFDLVDEDRNGLLDLDECKALFFLFACGRVCDLCSGLIIRDGVSCIYCSSVYFDLCGSCFHQTQQQHYYYYYYYSFQALPPLIRSGPQQQQLPPVIALQAAAPPPLQHYHNQGFPYHHPQFQLPFVHHHHHQHHDHAVAAPQQQNATNNTGGIGGAVYGALAVGNAVSNVISIASLCSIM